MSSQKFPAPPSLSLSRNKLGDLHNVPADRRFDSWEDLAKQPRLADACIIATPDQLHVVCDILCNVFLSNTIDRMCRVKGKLHNVRQGQEH